MAQSPFQRPSLVAQIKDAKPQAVFLFQVTRERAAYVAQRLGWHCWVVDPRPAWGWQHGAPELRDFYLQPR